MLMGFDLLSHREVAWVGALVMGVGLFALLTGIYTWRQARRAPGEPPLDGEQTPAHSSQPSKLEREEKGGL